MRYLLIDGDFFCHRGIHGMKTINQNITLDTNGEMINYEKHLVNSFRTLIRVFNNDKRNLIDNVIFVFDNFSWRKSITPIKPYYINDDTTPINYKENRKEQKEQSDLNYDNFSICKSNFIEKLKEIKSIAVFNVQGFEGDDALLMLKEKLFKPDNSCLVFCTDGDLKQLMYSDIENPYSPEYFMLYRNIKSSAAPEGEFVISKELCDKLYSTDIVNSFLNATDLSKLYFENLFNISLKDENSIVKRTKGMGISVASPTISLLIKIICGDKKDNIFPIFRWYTKTGSIRNVTERMVQVAFEELDFKFDEVGAQEVYNDKIKLTQLLYTLRENTKQDDIDIQIIGKHFAHNRMMLDIRKSTYISDELKSKFNSEFESQKSLIENKLNFNTINLLKEDYTDSTNILTQSLPDDFQNLI